MEDNEEIVQEEGTPTRKTLSDRYRKPKQQSHASDEDKLAADIEGETPQPAEQDGVEDPVSSENENVVQAATQTTDTSEAPSSTETAEESPQAYKGKLVARGLEAVAGRSPLTTGVVRGIEDTYNFVSWAGDWLEKATGLEKLLKNTIGRELFSDDPNSGRGAVSQYMYQSEGGSGTFVEEATRFGVGMIAPGGAIKGVGGAVVNVLKAPVFRPYVQNVRNIKQIQEGFRLMKSNPALQKFNEGALRGAGADFAITGEEDGLLSDFILNTRPEVQNVYFDSVSNDDPPSLMKRKLQAVAEGYLMGGVAGTVLDDLFTVLNRAKSNGVFSIGTRTAEEQAEIAARNSSDPLEGKTYQGEKITKLKNAKGEVFYAKVSDVDPENPGFLKKGKKGLFPEDAGPNIGVDEFSPDVTNSVETMVKRYRDAEKLAEGRAIADDRIGLRDTLTSDEVTYFSKVQKILSSTEDDLMKAIKNDDSYTLNRLFKGESISLKDLDVFKDEWGFASFDELQKAFPTTSPQEIAIYFYKVRRSMDMLNEFAEKNIDGLRARDPETLADYKEMSDMVGSFAANFDNLGSKAGRSLAIYGAYKKQMNEAMKSSMIQAKLKGVDVSDILSQVEAKMGLDANAKAYAAMRWPQKTYDVMSSVYHSNLLFGIVTQSVNLASGLVQSFVKTASRSFVANLSHDLASATAARAYIRKMTSMGNFMDSMTEAWTAFKKAEVPAHLMPSSDNVKYEQQFRIFNEMARSQSHKPILSNILGGLDNITSLPGRSLNAGDTFFRSMHFNSAWSEMITDRMVKNGMSSEEALQYANKIKSKDFSGLPKDMDIAALSNRISEESTELTYTMKPNAFQGAINNIINADIRGVKPLKFIFPFARVDMNIVRYTMQNTPGFHLLTSTPDVFKKGTQEQQERKMAEMMVSSTVILGGGYMVASNMLTGRGPSDPNELAQLRRTGWKPYSLRVPGYGYLELKRLGSLGNLLAMGGTAVDLLDSLDENDEAAGSQMTSALLGVLTDTFTPQYISQSLPELLDIIRNDDGKAYDHLMALTGRIAAESTIPGAGIYTRNARFAGYSSNVLEYNYDEDRLLNSIKRVFPHIDTDLKPQVDFLGNDRSRSPLTGTSDMDLHMEYERLADSGFIDTDANGIEKSIIFPQMRRTFQANAIGEMSKTYTMTNDEFYRYQKYAAGVYEDGSHRPPYGKTFAKLWRDEMNAGYPRAQAMYGSRSDEAVVSWLREEKRVYDTQAKFIIRSEKDVAEGMNQGRMERSRERESLLRGGPIRVR